MAQFPLSSAENLADLFSDESIGARVEMLSHSFANIGSVVLEDAINFIDKLLAWSNGDEKLTFDIHIPTWEEIQETAKTALTSITDGIKHFTTWTLGAFYLDGVSLKTITAQFEAWWTSNSLFDKLKELAVWALGTPENPESGAVESSFSAFWATVSDSIKTLAAWTLGELLFPNDTDIVEKFRAWWAKNSLYQKIKMFASWTLGSFIVPEAGNILNAVSDWWDNVIQPEMTELVQWTFGELILPAWADLVLSVANWWENDFLPAMTSLLTWNLGELELPSIESIQNKINTWWSSVTAGLNLSLSASYSRTFTQGELEQAQEDYSDQIDAITSPSLAPWSSKRNAPSKATGLDYVPYDGFNANLHVGEAVLSRPDAEAYRSSSASSFFDYEKLGQAINNAIDKKLSTLSVHMDGQKVGRLVAGTVSREIVKEARTLRYARI